MVSNTTVCCSYLPPSHDVEHETKYGSGSYTYPTIETASITHVSDERFPQQFYKAQRIYAKTSERKRGGHARNTSYTICTVTIIIVSDSAQGILRKSSDRYFPNFLRIRTTPQMVKAAPSTPESVIEEGYPAWRELSAASAVVHTTIILRLYYWPEIGGHQYTGIEALLGGRKLFDYECIYTCIYLGEYILSSGGLPY